ncbi:MAG: RNA-processing protein [Methanomicrobiales archaeon]|nr:RNA-processing protein [Methanomicrobiales archaeon]
MTTMQEIKVTASRIAVLIGKGGKTKREIEKAAGTVLTIDSEEGIVTVEGEDTLAVLRTVELIRAVNRGFSPERAGVLLEDEDLILDIIDLSPVCTSQKAMDRVRGRIIGREGRAREQIEDMTGCFISVMGKTVALIGLPEQLKTARAAIDMLVTGVPHETVYSFLDRKKKEAKHEILDYYY